MSDVGKSSIDLAYKIAVCVLGERSAGAGLIGDPLADQVDSFGVHQRSADLGHAAAGLGGLHAPKQNGVVGLAGHDAEGSAAATVAGCDGWLAAPHLPGVGGGSIEQQTGCVGSAMCVVAVTTIDVEIGTRAVFNVGGGVVHR